MNGFKRSSRGALLLLDILSITFTFWVAAYIRYTLLLGILGSSLYSELYIMLFLFVVLLYIIIFSTRNKDKKHFAEQGTIEIIVLTIRNQVYLLVYLVIFLFLIHHSATISRSVVGMFIVMNTIVDSALRIIYRNYLIKWQTTINDATDVCLVTYSSEAPAAVKHINGIRKSDAEGNEFGQINIRGIVLLDADSLCSTQIEEVSGIPVVRSYDDVNAKEVVLYKIPDDACRTLVKELEEKNVPYSRLLDVDGNNVGADMTYNLGNYMFVSESLLVNKCNVLGVNYTVSNIPEAVNYVKKHVEEIKGGYICFSNAHTSVMSRENEDYKAVQNGSAYTFSDGHSVVKQIQRKGYTGAKRVAGPDFMSQMFDETINTDIKHYFYGSTPETLDKLVTNLKKNYPGIQVAGVYSPPFRKLSDEEDKEIIDMINSSGADMLWVALGAPKQEKWMAEHKDKINAVMFGVGAAFDFHAGTIKRAPYLVQKVGLEWLYRLFQDPKRLIKRYVITNVKFVYYSLFDKK